MKALRALLSVQLCLGVCLSLFACSRGKGPDDATLVAEASRLLGASQVLDTLFFVEGLPTLSASDGDGYVKADTDKLTQWGFTSYASIQAYAEGIYSTALLADFERMAVQAVTDGSQLLRRAYCYDATDKDGNFLGFYVSTEGVHKQMDKAVYDLSTLTVKEKSASLAKLTVSATVTSHETGETQSRTVTVVLTYDGENWKLDTLTCLSFLKTTYDPL